MNTITSHVLKLLKTKAKIKDWCDTCQAYIDYKLAYKQDHEETKTHVKGKDFRLMIDALKKPKRTQRIT